LCSRAWHWCLAKTCRLEASGRAHGYSSSSQSPSAAAPRKAGSISADSSVNMGRCGVRQARASSSWRLNNARTSVLLNSGLFWQFIHLILKFTCSSWSTPRAASSAEPTAVSCGPQPGASACWGGWWRLSAFPQRLLLGNS